MSGKSGNEGKRGRRKLLCGECEQEFITCAVRDGHGNASEVEIYDCPNGHSGKRSFDSRGHLVQSMGIKYAEGHELHGIVGGDV